MFAIVVEHQKGLLTARDYVAGFYFTNKDASGPKSTALLEVLDYFNHLSGKFDCSTDFREHPPYAKIHVEVKQINLTEEEFFLVRLFARNE